MQRNKEKKRIGNNLYFFLGLFSAILFSVATPLSKLLLIEINEFLLAGLLYFGGALGVLPWIIIKKEYKILGVLKQNKKDRRRIIGSVFFGGFLGPVLLLFGLQLAKAGSVSIWLNFELVATAIIGILFFKESLDRNGIIGLVCMVLSGVFITIQEGIQGGLLGLLSALLVILACICWGIDNHTTGIIDHLSATQITYIKGSIAGGVNILIGIIYHLFREGSILSFNLPQWGQIGLSLLLGVFSYGFSILLYILTAQQLGSTRGQILFSSAPIIGVLLSFVILREKLDWFHLIAVCFTIIGIYFSNKTTHNHTHKHAPVIHLHIHSHDDEHHDHTHLKENEEKNDPSIHSHEHKHDGGDHSHKHYPDIHHRHH